VVGAASAQEQRPDPQQAIEIEISFEQADSGARTTLANLRTVKRDTRTTVREAPDFSADASPRLHRFQEAADLRQAVESDRSRGGLERAKKIVLSTEPGREIIYRVGGRYAPPVVASRGEVRAPRPVLRPQPFGFDLRLLPVLNEDGSIRIRTRAEVRGVDFANSRDRQGYFIPAVTKRNLEETIDLKPGQSYALTGFLNDEDVRNMERIPELELRHSLVQTLFAKKRNGPNTSLVVVLTPRIVLVSEEKGRQ